MEWELKQLGCDTGDDSDVAEFLSELCALTADSRFIACRTWMLVYTKGQTSASACNQLHWQLILQPRRQPLLISLLLWQHQPHLHLNSHCYRQHCCLWNEKSSTALHPYAHRQLRTTANLANLLYDNFAKAWEPGPIVFAILLAGQARTLLIHPVCDSITQFATIFEVYLTTCSLLHCSSCTAAAISCQLMTQDSKMRSLLGSITCTYIFWDFPPLFWTNH